MRRQAAATVSTVTVPDMATPADHVAPGSSGWEFLSSQITGVAIPRSVADLHSGAGPEPERRHESHRLFDHEPPHPTRVGGGQRRWVSSVWAARAAGRLALRLSSCRVKRDARPADGTSRATLAGEAASAALPGSGELQVIPTGEEDMGAWGTGSFENDDARDWIGDLAESAGLSAVDSALDVVATSARYLEAPECCAALAAAEVVAALGGRPGATVPEEVSTFARGHPRPSPALVATAKTANHKIMQQSELLDLWRDSDEFESWRAEVADLQHRLEGAG
jgi:uncharacterized protein DUF4259